VGVTRGLHSHQGLIMGVTWGLVQLKSKLIHGLGTWSGWLALVGPVASEEGQFGLCLLIPLP